MDISTKTGAVASFTGVLLAKIGVLLDIQANYTIPNWALSWGTALCLLLGSCAAGISIFEWVRRIRNDIRWNKDDLELKEENDKEEERTKSAIIQNNGKVKIEE